MKLSTLSRYGLRAMVDICNNQDSGPVSIRIISKRQRISVKYLEMILIPLKSKKLIKSTRGSNGGYELAKNPLKITVGDIIRIMDGPIIPVDCLGKRNRKTCDKINSCATRLVWMRVKQAIDEIVDSVTLYELSQKQDELNKLFSSI